MNKFSQVIHNLYNKFLPIAEQSGIELNLDYSDPATLDIDVETDDPELKTQLEEELKNAITRANSGSVKLKVTKGGITISDTGTILSHPLCEALSHGRVSVKSRVGFGTNVDIAFARPEESKGTETLAEPAKITAKSAKPAKSTTTSKTKTPKSTKKH